MFFRLCLFVLVSFIVGNYGILFHNLSDESLVVANYENFDFSNYAQKDVSKEELTQQNVIDNLKEDGKLNNRRVLLALQKYQRINFMSHEEYPVVTLLNLPHNIGYNAFMESLADQAIILEILANHLNPGDKVLEIGTGTGYLTTLLAAMVGVSGKVYTIEHIKELLESARKRVKSKAEHFMRRINFYIGQGKNGLSKEAPFSAIYIGGSVPQLPIELIKQLKPGGRLVVPIKSDEKHPILTIIDRYVNNTVVTTQVQRIFIEPLRDVEEQRRLNRTWEDDYFDDFNRNTPPPMPTDDIADYTGYYHTDRAFMQAYEIANARPHLFTVHFNPFEYSIIGTKPKQNHTPILSDLLHAGNFRIED